MSEIRCCLDVDGVLADLVGALARVHEVDLGAAPHYPRWPAGAYDLTTALGKPYAKVWEHPLVTTAGFWRDLALTPWSSDLVEILESRFGKVCLLTGAVRDPSCAAGKAEWIRAHFPGRPWFVGPSWAKPILAIRERWLVDDSDENCEAWEAAGGRAILLPRPWNTAHARARDPLGAVVAALLDR